MYVGLTNPEYPKGSMRFGLVDYLDSTRPID